MSSSITNDYATFSEFPNTSNGILNGNTDIERCDSLDSIQSQRDLVLVPDQSLESNGTNRTPNTVTRY